MNGRWSAHEFGQAFSAISDLYDLRFVLEVMRDEQREWENFYEEFFHFGPLRKQWKLRARSRQIFPGLYFPNQSVQLDTSRLDLLHEFLEPSERLEVRKLSYASPGVSDLAGVGTIIGHLKDFVLKLIERRDAKRQRDMNVEKTAVEIEAMRIENARNFVALGRDLGFSKLEMRKLISHADDKQEVLINLIEQKKLTGVSIVGKKELDEPD